MTATRPTLRGSIPLIYNTPGSILAKGGKILCDAGMYDAPAKNTRPGGGKIL